MACSGMSNTGDGLCLVIPESIYFIRLRQLDNYEINVCLMTWAKCHCG